MVIAETGAVGSLSWDGGAGTDVEQPEVALLLEPFPCRVWSGPVLSALHSVPSCNSYWNWKLQSITTEGKMRGKLSANQTNQQITSSPTASHYTWRDWLNRPNGLKEITQAYVVYRTFILEKQMDWTNGQAVIVRDFKRPWCQEAWRQKHHGKRQCHYMLL